MLQRDCQLRNLSERAKKADLKSQTGTGAAQIGGIGVVREAERTDR